MTRKKNEYEKAVEWLKERIGNRGQAAAAEKMGASTSTLNRVLNGGNQLSMLRVHGRVKWIGRVL